MKRSILLLTAVLTLSGVKAQITLDHAYPSSSGITINLDKFHQSGYKYTEVDIPNLKINIYNLNHSLYKSISIPSVPGNKSIYYISENLFDTDNLVEFAMTTTVAVTGPTPGASITNLYIFKENGTQLFFQDSANFVYNNFNNSFNVADCIFSDGTGTKMEISIQKGALPGISYARTEIYNLPGTIPCNLCSQPQPTIVVTTGIKEQPGRDEALFYPNPVTDQLKLKYTLPADAKTATIKINDLQGKEVESFTVTSSFDSLLVPSNFNNGMYLYSLIVNGQTIKTEKIILDK